MPGGCMELKKCDKKSCNPTIKEAPCCGMEYSISCNVCKKETKTMSTIIGAKMEWRNILDGNQ